MKLLLLCIFLTIFCVSEVFCWVSVERTEFTDTNLQSLGYSCMPVQYNVGPMRNGETKNLVELCGRAVCRDNGVVEYSGCLIPPTGPGCVVVPGEVDKPYPSCCESSKC